MNALEGIGIESALTAEAERKAAEDEVGQNQFLNMLVAQLENQDPLNPQDSADFAAQLAQFSTVEQLIAMRAGIDKLVQAISPENGAAGNAKGIDPTSLVGKEVVVFGSQIEVNAEREPITMPIRLVEDALEAKVRIYDAKGKQVHQQSILPVDANGDDIALRPGDHEFVFDPYAHNLAEGIYAIEFDAVGVGGDAITILPMIEGTVTGAILAGDDSSIRIGSRVFSIDDILEVRQSQNANAVGGPTGSTGNGTGGGQAVVRQPQSANAIQGAAGGPAYETGGGQTVFRQPWQTPR